MEANEVLDWIQTACDEMAYDEVRYFNATGSTDMCGSITKESTKHLKKLVKEGVKDLAGRYADDLYNDPELLADLIGDHTYGEPNIDKLLDELADRAHPALKKAVQIIKER